MFVGQLCDLAAAGSALYKSFLYKIRLIHLFYSAGVFAECCRYGGETDGTAAEFADYRVEYLVVDFIKAVAVDI